MYIYASLVLAADWLMAAAVAMRMRAGYISARRSRDRLEFNELVLNWYGIGTGRWNSRRRRAGAAEKSTARRPGVTQRSSVRDSVEAAGIAVLPGGRETRGDAVVYGRRLDGGR